MIGLRELAPDDARAVREIYSGRSVRFLGRGDMGGDEAMTYVGNALVWSTHQPRLRYVLGIDGDGDLVGVVKLNLTADVGRLSYILRRNTWGRGYATCAVSSLLAFAFGPLSLSAVHAKHRVRNRASGRVLLKAGFTHTETAHGFSLYAAKRTAEPTPTVGAREGPR
ncbi:GNAT family N-acetyltransferase [Streptomyces sp. NPDC055036]